MMATRVNFDYWKNVALIQIWEAAMMMHGYDPRARQFGFVPMNSEDDELDLSDDHHMLVVAVLANELEAKVEVVGQVDKETYLSRISFAAWARTRGLGELADGLEGLAKHSGPPTVSSGSSAAGSKFLMKRSGLVKQHQHQWPTIEADIKEASKNGLSNARVGSRGWNEALAVEWARSKGKLSQPALADVTLARSMANWPVTTHRMKR